MRDASMMVRADAKANGMVTSHTTRVAPRWQGSTASQRERVGVGTSECVSYKLDADGQKIDAHIFHARREHISRKARKRRNVENEMRMRLLNIADSAPHVD